MVGRKLLVALVAGCGACVALPVQAQQVDTVNRTPSLGERLEQFRNDLIGPAPNKPANPPPRASANTSNDGFQFGASRKANGQVSPSTTSASQPQQQQQQQPTPAAPANTGRVQSNPFVTPPPPPLTTQTQQQPRPATQTRPANPGQSPAVVSGGQSLPQSRTETAPRSGLETQSARKATPSGAPSPANLRPMERAAEVEANPTRTASKPAIDPLLSDDDQIVEEPQPTRAKPAAAAPRTAATPAAPAVEATRAAREPAAGSSNNAASDGVLFAAQSPVISVETSGPKKIMIGKEAQFVIKLRNSGAAANNVVVNLDIPTDAEVAGAHASAGAAHLPTPGERREPLEWRLTRLEAKSAETLTLKIVPRKSTPLDLAVRWTFTPESSQTLVEVQEPKLQMTVSGPEEVRFGQSKIYKLTISNPGNGDTENVVVALLPVGRESDGIASHRVGTLRAGESRSIDVELTARQAGVLTMKAQSYADGGLRAEAAQQVLVRRAALQIEVESPKIKYAGTVGTYRVKVTNSGNDTAENVQITALLPPESKYVTSTGGGRHETQQGKVNWAIGSLPAGAQRDLELQCSLAAPGDNRLQFMSMGDGDLSAATTANTRVEALADLKLEVKDPQGPIAIGEPAVYEVHIRNRGTKAAENVELTVFFSEGLEAISAEGGLHDIAVGQVNFRPIATIGAGESAVLRVHSKSDRSGSHVFRAEVVCQSLRTRLAAEQATHFYGDEAPTARLAAPLYPRNLGEGAPSAAPPSDGFGAAPQGLAPPSDPYPTAAPPPTPPSTPTPAAPLDDPFSVAPPTPPTSAVPPTDLIPFNDPFGSN